MSARLDWTLDRRRFIKQTALGAVALTTLSPAQLLRAQDPEDRPNTHNMLVVGQNTIFLSHLPMFDGLDTTKTAFLSPHRYQVILEATFTIAGKDVGEIYRKDRQAHATTRIYTLRPETFVISRLFTPVAKPQIPSFTATVFRGHLEDGGKPVRGLEKVSVNVTRVVHGRQFEPQAKKPAELEYLLFGKGAELFLAHAIVSPPDFDQVLSVRLSGHELTDNDLTGGGRIVVANRKNVAADRLREKQNVPATLQIGTAAGSKVKIEAGTQHYFEEGELLVPATFDPTPEEKKK